MYSHDGLHTEEPPHFVILNPESEVHTLKHFLSDTTVNLTALSKTMKQTVVGKSLQTQYTKAAERSWLVAAETTQQLVLEIQPELQAL